MGLLNARTSAEPEPDAEPVPINFTFDITDGQLLSVTAVDDEGRSYTVSIKLAANLASDLCCCPTATGQLKCLRVAQCACDPI